MTNVHAEVIGDPIAQSKSPVIHNFWLEKLGRKPTYGAEHVRRAELAGYIAQRRADPSWRGCNVTMPHKQSVIPMVDKLDPVARRIGAVNTLVCEHNILAGYNTDAAGFLEPLRPELECEHRFRTARVLGTGGAARAIVTALAGHGFAITLAGRRRKKARALLEELAPDGDHYALHLGHFAKPSNVVFDDREGCLDLVVNASPLGMLDQPRLVLDWNHAPPGAIAYDIVTSPRMTEFLSNARAAGHRTLDGLNMLIGQAAIAFELFFRQHAPREYDAELRELLSR